MLKKLFNALQTQPQKFLNAKAGAEFEERLRAYLRMSLRYNEVMPSDFESYAEMKKACLQKNCAEAVANDTGVDKCYIYQPNGSQNYPDFLVFEARAIICIETKFSKSKPVWNSGLPRPNGVYILGNPVLKDITFFRGCDVVSVADGEKMHAFFDELRSMQNEFNAEHMREQSHGFAVYIRKAFEQKKMYNPNAKIDFYTNAARTKLQARVLKYLEAMG